MVLVTFCLVLMDQEKLRSHHKNNIVLDNEKEKILEPHSEISCLGFDSSGNKYTGLYYSHKYFK